MPKVGDVVFAHSNGIAGRLIRFGERIRWGEKASHWNHACIVSRIDTDGTAWVIQAQMSGVKEARLDSVGEYITVTPPCDPAKVVEFSQAQINDHYGLMTILCVALDIITPNFFPEFRRADSWICSAVTAEALRYAGWLHDWADIYTVTPSQLFQALN